MKKLSLAAIAALALAAVPASAVAPAPVGPAQDGAKQFSPPPAFCALVGMFGAGKKFCQRNPVP